MRNQNKQCILFMLALSLGWFAPLIHADDTRHKPDVKAWKNFRAQGIKAMEQKKFAAAVSAFTSALDEARNFGPEDDRLADSLMDLANAFWNTRDFVQSEPLLREAAKIRHGDPNAGLEADCVYQLARNGEILGHYDEAATNFERVETLISRKLGADNPLAVECLFRRGKIYFAQGDYARAEPVLKRSVEMLAHPVARIVARDNGTGQGLKNFYRRTYEPDYVNALDGLSRLNTIYISQNRLPEAEHCLTETLKIVDDTAAKGDPALAHALAALSKYYLSTTNYAAAEPLMQRWVRQEEKTHGATNDATLNAEDELGRVYEHEKKDAEAEALFQKIAAASDGGAGPDSRQSALAVARLARFYFDQGQYEKAEPLYRRQFIHAEKFGGNVDLTPVLSDQVIMYSKLGRDAELEAAYKKQIAVFEKMLGPGTRALVTPLNDCAALLRKKKRGAEAEPLEARARAIQAAQTK